jgi:hypothetical protein
MTALWWTNGIFALVLYTPLRDQRIRTAKPEVLAR